MQLVFSHVLLTKLFHRDSRVVELRMFTFHFLSVQIADGHGVSAHNLIHPLMIVRRLAGSRD